MKPYRLLEDRPIRLYLEGVRGQGSLYAPLDSIPPEVLEILVAREDPSFYVHKGVLPRQIIRAFKRSLRTKSPMAGTSTITQQLMKNLYLNPERSVLRKANEIALALRVEKTGMLTKDEILEIYFNCVKYGPDVYGIADASAYYFGKTPDALTRNQAVFLATLTPAPYRLRPLEDPFSFAKERNGSLYVLAACRVVGVQEAQELAHTHPPRLGLDPELRQIRDIFGVATGPKTADGLASYARAQLGAPYWRGAYGQVATLGLLNHSRWSWPDDFGKAGFLDELGARVFDDAGLIKGYLWSSSPSARPRYDKLCDWSSAELYEHAEAKGDIGSFDYGNGRLVYAGETPETIAHVGIYSSDGLVCHAKDRVHGVVAEPFVHDEWAYWSEMPVYATNSNLVSYTELSYGHPARRAHPVTRIALQRIEDDLPVEVFGALFADGGQGGPPSYGIGSDGRIAMYAGEGNESLAEGNSRNDDRIVRIACAQLPDGSLSDACRASLADLCADIRMRNGFDIE